MYSIRIAEPSDETKIRELFLEMMQSIFPKENVKGYPDDYLNRFWGEVKIGSMLRMLVKS